jgi:hypothetical protein
MLVLEIHSKAHKSSFKNKTQVLKSRLCGCFHCCERFSPDKIEEWADGDLTALCPHCHIDAIICDTNEFPVTEKFLSEMKQIFFSRNR